MAGGAGTRFWPESRASRPKQLLKLVGQRTMIQSTVDRLGKLVPPERILVVTNARLVDAIVAQLPQLPRTSILGEPCKRDTAPCIGLAALQISRDDPDAVMAVLPSDQVIEPVAAFQQALGTAIGLVEQSPARIVTFGVRPTYPAMSFGYIERGQPLASAPAGVYRVDQFREKPPTEVARRYVAAGNFYWNSGIFVWRARTILDALQQHEPVMFGHLQAIAAAYGRPDYASVLDCEFAAIRGVSIDYAVMEHARDVVVVEAPFTWDDVGSWQSIARLQGVDADGNTVQARHVGLSTTGTIIRSND